MWPFKKYPTIEQDVKKNNLIQTKKYKREILSLIFYYLTDQATYLVYNTQTLQGVDCVNIVIKRVGNNGSNKIILEDEIFEDSWGAMGGDAFVSLIIDAHNHLDDYIKEKQETVLFHNYFRKKDDAKYRS